MFMPRRSRIVIPGMPHHVTQRGNNREVVFHSDGDRRFYLDVVEHHTRENQVRILGYCLMTNHVHLIVVPERPESLARALKCAHAAYAHCWNRFAGRSGHLWQGRFYSCPLDPSHLESALRYVDLNPVRAGLVATASEWRWSSARAHVDPAKCDRLLGLGWMEWFGGWDHAEWVESLGGDGEDGDGWAALRRSTLSGAPCGSDEFVERLETLQGRRLRVGERGRPRKVLIET